MVLVIGGSGFVGSALINELNNDRVLNFDKNPSPFYNDMTTIGNICDKSSMSESFEGVNTVVLLAAEHRDDVSPISLYYDVNIEGTKNVLDCMDEFGVKNLIFTSSVAIYGLNKVNPTEEHEKDPFNHYGKSKLEAEGVIHEWFDKDPLTKSVTILRPTVIFGERNRGNVYNLFKVITSGKFCMVGKGFNKKSMAYVGNVVSVIKNMINNPVKGLNTYNYADKPDLTMRQLIKLTEEKLKIKVPKIYIPYWFGIIIGYLFDSLSFFTKKKFPISSIRIKKFCATTQFDAEKIHSLITVPFSIEDALSRTLQYEFVDEEKDSINFFTE